MSLTLFLGYQLPIHAPDELGAVVGDQPARDLLSIACIDRRPRRARRAKRQAAELQPRRRRRRAFLDEVERDLPHFGVLFLFQHFQTVDDRSDRTDHVMANARASQRRQIQTIKREYCHWLVPVISDVGRLTLWDRALSPYRDGRRESAGEGLWRTNIE